MSLPESLGGHDYNEWRFALQAPWGRAGLAVALACALAILVLAVFSTRGEPLRRRLTLIALRTGSVAAALVLFLQPAIQLENVTRIPNHVAVLVDQSASMSLSEQPGKPSRAARAAALLAAGGPTFEAWRKTHTVDFYTFGNQSTGQAPAAEKPAPVAPDSKTTGDGKPAASPGAKTAEKIDIGATGDLQAAMQEQLAHVETAGKAGGDRTLIRESLAQLRSRYEGKDLGGVVLISDGIDNGRLGGELSGSELDVEGQDFLRSLDVPVHTVWTGTPGLRDVAIARVLADDFAFARTAVKVEAVVRVRGAEGAGWEGKKLPVTLKRDGQTVRTIELEVDAAKPEQKVTFEFTPDRVGKYLYEISVPVLDGDAIPDNNARTFLIKVIRDKVRVLLVAGRPSWDERFLRGLLKHNPNVDLISFFILRTPLDIDAVSPDEMSLIPFPTDELFREQLRSFDLVIMQNFNYGPYGIGAYLNEIREYVFEGGGFAMIGGDLSFTSGGYANSPVAEVLPVDLLDPGPEDKLVSLEPFKLRVPLPSEQRGHPITALTLDVADNQARWEALPPLEGCNLVMRARQGATVLATHPTLRDSEGKLLPVLTVQEVGKGRSLAFLSDSSWRWGFGTAGSTREGGAQDLDTRGRAYQKFWENAMRWLVRDPELRLLRVETDQPEYDRGARVRVVVRARDAQYRPAKNLAVALTIARGAGSSGAPQPPISKTLHTDDNGDALLELDPLPPGGYRVTARASIGTGAIASANQDDEVFLVRGAARELEDAEARDELLRAIAEGSGGTYLGEGTEAGALENLSFEEPQVVRVNQHRDLELWSTWITLILAASLLSLEWLLRRRTGLV